MIFLRKFNSWHFLQILQLHKPPLNPIASTCLNSSTPYQSAQFSSYFLRPFSLSAQSQQKESANSEIVSKKKHKKSLGVFFQEAVGLIEKSEQSEKSEDESENEVLKCKLRNLEEEVRILLEKKKNEKANRKKEEGKNGNGVCENEGKSKNLQELFVNEEGKNVKSRKSTPLTMEARSGNGVCENEGKSKKLHELFVNEKDNKSVKSRKSTPLTMEDHNVYKELSPDMVMFVTHLYNEGYFKDSNFLPRKRFDITCFESSYARDFVKYAAEQFGRDHQEIAKWLSGSDLKNVALFGCPSVAKKTVFSAKRLRTYFRIQEDNVCRKCALKASCKFVNQSVWKGDMTNLHLAVVMRVITLYALESVPPQLVIPDEIKASVSRLLKDIVRLSQTVS
ncbi:uncharacterized protein [Nicotiana sylvestris]|uniref:Uncharacterized protein n=2 Tax=Nicotiana TaxID=4085 RepID=A0A1S4DCV3_TOBAC|nr:PREDICTED: uncharacterized protein LOC104232295 [Nicotiana sylvestris]XP_016511272.1 PREDICTED: uncharacterized protein LOC107828468 [Nicotiana tabacum]